MIGNTKPWYDVWRDSDYSHQPPSLTIRWWCISGMLVIAFGGATATGVNPPMSVSLRTEHFYKSSYSSFIHDTGQCTIFGSLDQYEGDFSWVLCSLVCLWLRTPPIICWWLHSIICTGSGMNVEGYSNQVPLRISYPLFFPAKKFFLMIQRTVSTHIQ